MDSNPVEVQTDSIGNTDADGSASIWKETPMEEDVEKTREREFEEYLADLLMWVSLR